MIDYKKIVTVPICSGKYILKETYKRRPDCIFSESNEEMFLIHIFASHKILILNVSVKCSLTRYLICFLTISAFATQYPLVASITEAIV